MSSGTTEPDKGDVQAEGSSGRRPEASARKRYDLPTLVGYGTLVEVTAAMGSVVVDSGGNLRT